MSVTQILMLLAIHFVADFVFQTGGQATKKSSANWWLTGHCIVYTIITGILFLVYCAIYNLDSVGLYFGFLGITFVCHWITDYFTSKVTSQKFNEKEYYTSIPNTGAFTIIGFDQLLHYIQIFITYQYLFL